MAGQPTPPLIQEAFAKNADPAFIATIPVTTGDSTRASFDLGFPPLTMTQIFAGGNPPYGQDMNGILNMLSAHIVAAQAGQPYLYSATLSGVMGGYAAGCVLGMADGTGMWLNNVAGNVTNPDDSSAAGWVPLYSYGFAQITGLSGGTLVLNRQQFRRGVIVLTGALAGNQQIIMPAGTAEGQRSWLIVNACTGAFAVTVQTPSGGGVAIPAGGFSAPTEVYGDGTNIYPTVAPITLPTDINPTPNTIALRTNAGYLFATYFNQSSGVENFTMAAVYADAGDGFHRKISLANFAAQIALTQFAGQVAPAQVPYAAISQYLSLIYTGASLTNPITTNRALGDATQAVANTAFVNPGSSLAATGYRLNPDGTIDQWGFSAPGTVTFPRPFPTACTSFVATAVAGGAVQTWLGSVPTRFAADLHTSGGSAFWRAVGF